MHTYVWGVMVHVSLESYSFPFAEVQSSPVTSTKCIIHLSSFRIVDLIASILLCAYTCTYVC